MSAIALEYDIIDMWWPKLLFLTFQCWQVWFKLMINPANEQILWGSLKVDMPILTCIFFTFNWLTLTSEMHFVKFHPVVASCLLSRGKRKYAPLGMRLLQCMKIHKKLFSGIPINFTIFGISPKLQRIWSWNFGFAIRKIWAFIWYQKIYYFRLSPGEWECDRHKGL